MSKKILKRVGVLAGILLFVLFFLGIWLLWPGFQSINASPYQVPHQSAVTWSQVFDNPADITVEPLLTAVGKGDFCRMMDQNDPDFRYLKNRGNPTDLKEFAGYTFEYLALHQHLFQPRLYNVPDTLLQINTDKKIITPTEFHFGRSFGHIFRRLYFDGTHEEFIERLRGEGYQYKIK